MYHPSHPQLSGNMQYPMPSDSLVAWFSLPLQPIQYKLTSKLARLLGVHTATRPDIINAVWQYIKVSGIQASRHHHVRTVILLLHLPLYSLKHVPFRMMRSLEACLTDLCTISVFVTIP